MDIPVKYDIIIVWHRMPGRKEGRHGSETKAACGVSDYYYTSCYHDCDGRRSDNKAPGGFGAGELRCEFQDNGSDIEPVTDLHPADKRRL